jgi:hypothetical protein
MSGRTGIWGKPEWQKAKYQPTPETHKGKIIFYNLTPLLAENYTPSGQNVKIKINGSTIKDALEPNQKYVYQPEDNKPLRVELIPQMKKYCAKHEFKVPKPLSQVDHTIEILTLTSRKLGLTHRHIVAKS